jgi:hypothetical protein
MSSQQRVIGLSAGDVLWLASGIALVGLIVVMAFA